jgi:ankyrin repeat protein
MELTPARAQAATILLKHAPQTARLKDHHGCTAMHYLMKNPSNQIPRELMLTFLNHDGFALERKNNNGQSPLDIFVAFGQDTASVRAEALDICQVLRISTTLTSVDVVVGH